jgi:hypothetical protein
MHMHAGGRRVGSDTHEIHALVEINPLDNLVGMAHFPMIGVQAASSGMVSWGNRMNRRCRTKSEASDSAVINSTR